MSEHENGSAASALNRGHVYRKPQDGAPPQHVDAPQPTPLDLVRVRGNIQKNEVNAYVHVDETALGDLTGAVPFADRFEQAQAFADPRYSRSAAFRKEVARRCMVSGR
jgi:hypothetical protein